MRNSFPLTQSKSGHDLKFIQHLTVRVQSKISNIRHSRVQSNPNAVLTSDIYNRGGHGSGVIESTPAGFFVYLSEGEPD